MKKRLLGGFTALLLATSFSTADATVINTGGITSAISPFGEPNTATYGQTFRLNSGDDTSLDSVTFYLNDYSNPDTVDFAFYVYQWSGNRITGDSLFTSGMMSTTGQSGWETFMVNTGGVGLSTDTDYAFFISASNFFDGLYGTSTIGATANTYANGNFVFMNNGNNFNLLSSTAWNQWYGYDLAFDMQLSPSSRVPEPSTLLLIGSGLAGLGFMRKFRKG